MTTTPAAYAAKVVSSSSFSEARSRAPKIVQSYLLDFPVATARAKIREEFEKNRYVSDLRVIDVLIFKGRAEYQETLNNWKMDTHIMRYFSKDESPPKPEGFLEKFYGIGFNFGT
ncbi:8983_t:CDS:2 [Racocetra fulgida]|uniref:8983_t:CDS:1 n=1 Tax=Racocetra fulgida TaxID=60492 RepID=A0A9N9F536_9GLOM|nr:8983_t:CDS:2 [Racocetra fulgida]